MEHNPKPLFFALILAAASCSFAQADIRILAVTNAASFAPGLPARGGLATIFCTGLTGVSDILVGDSIPLPLVLGGVAVKVRGVPAPLLAVAATDAYQQINFQVPWELPIGALPSIEVSQNGQSVHLDLMSAEVDIWAAFFVDLQGYGVFQHFEDYSFVTPEHPARLGEWLIGYATGLGDVNPPVPTGYPAPMAPLSRVAGSHPDVSLGARNANVDFIGLAPGMTGVYQINFQVPDSVSAGDVQLSFSETSCGPFGVCGSPFQFPPVTSYGPSVKVPIR